MTPSRSLLQIGLISAPPSQVPAPIESVEIPVLESYPVRYVVRVVSGLPNGCVSFAGYRLGQESEAIQVEVHNWEPTDQGRPCAEEYRIVEHHVYLATSILARPTRST